MQSFPKVAFTRNNLFVTLSGLAFVVSGALSFTDTIRKKPGVTVLFPLAFVGIGCLLLGWGLFAIFQESRRRKAETEHPNQPWMVRRDWSAGKIKDGARAGALGMAGFAFFWVAMTWAILATTLEKAAHGNAETKNLVFMWIFPLMAAVLVAVALYKLLRWRKYGTSVFEMAKVPGVIGGRLEGIIWTRASLRERDGVTVKLRSIHRWTGGAGKQRTMQEETLWSCEKRLTQHSESRLTRNAIDVQLAIPQECTPTKRVNGGEEFLWQLEASAKTPGIDYKAVFVVPVFELRDGFPTPTV